ncbi:hypothetical protein BST27_16055 [Mycobacterium intermedium]|uniref:Uncharacterized protein n=1 Tax=Mycobacterium intermedium TaxID=28445 RepID=A0A1E3SL51_MYCIE|nr:hypothetical protein [Mycobacterium intermedium]MCV6963492.1 hypothetical protein [Mycobacterium intermedium]ODR02866.1 hypothetical protein BHQ20_02725 [Mycobacterium intermedium]OPE49906.1 hypothetical protein BV508_12165 [Mycobacterium intermedium]ORB02757.1 hypothetical protein BST27_16055 [Mycobacterium intermedium]
MAAWLDVAGRLAEGRPAVERTQSYVQACERVGCVAPDLDVADEYGSEEGLDLRALDDDCARLRAAGAAVMEALRMQRAQVAELAAAWSGPGADAAVAFLQRHCDTANAIATEIRAAAQRCESLRDNLWRLVDAKVAAAIEIDDRSAAQRPDWLAAVAAVSTGAGDHQTAEAVVRQQVNPYVHNDIGNDWYDAMRSARTGVAAYYDMVNDRLAGAPAASFEIPGDLGPAGGPSVRPAVGRPTFGVAAPSAPAGFGGRPADPGPPIGTAMQPSATSPPATTDVPLPQPFSGLGSAGGLGGLGAIAGRIIDTMGDAVGGALAPSDPGDADSFDGDGDGDGDDAEDDHDDDNNDDDRRPRSHHDLKESDKADRAHAAATPHAVTQAPGTAEPSAGPTQVVTPPAPPDAATPCEIAADELPKAGQ